MTEANATLNFLIEGCTRLHEVRLKKRYGAARWTPKSRAYLEAFKAKQLAENRNVKMTFE